MESDDRNRSAMGLMLGTWRSLRRYVGRRYFGGSMHIGMVVVAVLFS
jgi:hypothetical protein